MGSMVNTHHTENEIKAAIIKDGIDSVNLGVKPINGCQAVFVTGFYSNEESIPLFSHPILIEFRGKQYLCTDLRLYVNNMLNRASVSEINDCIKNKTEFNFIKSRTVLNMAWLKSPNQLKNGFTFPASVYSSLVSQLISGIYALDYTDKIRIQIIAYYFYFSLFTDEKDKDTEQQWASQIIQLTKTDANTVDAVVSRISRCDDLDSFCATVKEVCDNSRLEDFNKAIFLTMMRNIWFGVNAKENIAVSLEHPPSWIAMVYAAAQERTFKNSGLTKTVELLGKRGVGDEFLRSYGLLVSEYVYDRQALENAELITPVGNLIGDFDE